MKKYHANLSRLEREIKAENGFNKINYDILNKVIEEVDFQTHTFIKSEDDYYELIKDYYYEDIMENCEHEDYESDTEETSPHYPDDNTYEYKVYHCNYCGRYAYPRTEMTEDGPDEVIDSWELED